MPITKQEKTRFDTRIPKDQKILFEKAAKLGGYRNLTDFVVRTVFIKANEIIKENEQVIASEIDAKIFFDSIMNSKNPNEDLMNLANDFKALNLK